jgi:hypothetical protein
VKPILATAIGKFTPNGIATELCEADNSCNQDQGGFKAIFLRQLAHLYQATEDTEVKSSIAAVVNNSATAALKTCDRDWNCKAGWTANSTVDYPAFRSTHLVAAAVVAAEGISRWLDKMAAISTIKRIFNVEIKDSYIRMAVSTHSNNEKEITVFSVVNSE